MTNCIREVSFTPSSGVSAIELDVEFVGVIVSLFHGKQRNRQIKCIQINKF